MINLWEVHDSKLERLAAVIRNVVKLKDELLNLNPWLSFPQSRCCYSFGERNQPLPVGALFILWEEWPACTGSCPACGGSSVFGYAFGGLLNIGGVSACCVACERKLYRHIGGLGTVTEQIYPILRQTPYFIKTGLFGGAFEGPRAPLIQALRQLGAADLPKEI